MLCAFLTMVPVVLSVKDPGPSMARFFKLFSPVSPMSPMKRGRGGGREKRGREREREGGRGVGREEEEVAELRRRDAEMETVSDTENHVHFIKSYRSLSSPIPELLFSIKTVRLQW